MQQPLVRPAAVRPGDKVAIVSTSSPVSPDELERLSGYFVSRGHPVRVAPGAGAATGYLAGPREQHAADLMAAFTDPDVKLIVSASGGKGAAHLLELFAHARETYVIYPWVRDGDELVRPLRFGAKDAQIAVARIAQAAPDRLEARVNLRGRATDGLAQVREALVRCLQLDYPYDQIEALAAKDRVLRAALNHRGLGRGKLYPDLFEALCGVVCAQRTSFARIYSMMRKLTEAFGEPTAESVDGATVFAFPTPAQMAAASGEQLRACSVGFRARGLANVASYLAGSGYTWQDWKTRDPAEVIPDLLGIKGVGPYTANLAVNLTYDRGGTAHVDTYVCNVIGSLYLDNPDASPEQVAQFIDHRWGGAGRARARSADHRHRGLGGRAGRHGRSAVRCAQVTTAYG